MNTKDIAMKYIDEVLSFNDYMNDDFLSKLSCDELYKLSVDIDNRKYPDLLSPSAFVMQKYREKKHTEEKCGIKSL
jgi:hypothetical protein